MAFTKKIIEVHITLANGEFSNHTTTKIIRGLPITYESDQAGLPSRGTAKVRIYGIKLEDLEALTFLSFKPLYVNLNKIAVYAGDEETGLSLEFAGEITSSYPEYNNAPDVYLEIEAMSGYYSGMLAVPPYTFKGSIPIATVIQTLSSQMGYTFVNEGETKQILNPYLEGSPVQKIIQLVKTHNLDVTISNNTVRLRASNVRRRVKVVLSKDTGLLGYPSFTENGLRLRANYIPTLELGDVIEVESIVPRASGQWEVISFSNSLGSDTPDAPWFTNIETVYIAGK